jgi:anaerobic selenocysteine-containing dehydrogenase
MYARLIRALGAVPDEQLEPLREAARQGRRQYAAALADATTQQPQLAALLPYVLYETLGPALPDGADAAAALWGLAHRAALKYPDAIRRAGHADGEELFDAMLKGRSGITFTVDDYDDVWTYVAHADRRIPLEIPELLDELRALRDGHPDYTSPELPMILSAGERRSSTANTIIRDPAWRKRDSHGALRISEADAARLGLDSGDRARITTRAGSAETIVEVTDSMLPGHVALPNGQGLDYPAEDGRQELTGVPANELTSLEWRDPFAGTPWHKHVPARVERVS